MKLGAKAPEGPASMWPYLSLSHLATAPVDLLKKIVISPSRCRLKKIILKKLKKKKNYFKDAEIKISLTLFTSIL